MSSGGKFVCMSAANEPIEVFTFAGGGSEAEILTHGASIVDLRVPIGSESRSVVLGLADLAQYPAHKAFLGAIAGRCANRIAGGRFRLDGNDYQLSLNEPSGTHLHGGTNGFFNRVWTVDAHGADHITLSIVSPAGEEGYPGNLRATCTYRFAADGRLAIDLEARTDAATLVNLATHSYFNLGNSDTILDHVLTIPADSYTPVDEKLVPTGEISPVTGNGMDFRRPAVIGARREMVTNGFDHNYVLAKSASAKLRLAARLEAPARDLALEIWSTEPGLQFYDGQHLPLPFPLRGRGSHRFGGLCLEPQKYPDAIHHTNFPSTVLRPAETYRQRTEYRFSS